MADNRESTRFDTVVIGGGPGGYVAAIASARKGMKTALVEANLMGGTCTNVGCIPAKAMLAAASLVEEMSNGKRLGITVDGGKAVMNYADVCKHRDRAVLTSRKGVELLMKKNGIAVFQAKASLVGKNEIKLSSGETINGTNIIIATGSTPVKFPPFDRDDIWTSDDIWPQTELPESIAIIGGGVIGVEMGTFFALAGVRTAIFELMPTLIPMEDEDTAKELEDSLKHTGIKVYTGAKVSAVEGEAGAFTVKATNSKGDIEFSAARILISVGRKPVLPDGLEAAGVKLTQKGYIDIDDTMRTTVPNIYAVGDVTGKLMLAHTASAQGEAAVDAISGKPRLIDYNSIPNVIFTNPEVASVGKKEKELIQAGIPFSKGVYPVSASGKAKALGINRGFVKVLSHKDTGVILGVALICHNATDMIMEGVIAVAKGLTAHDLDHIVHPHPTLTEMIREAAAGSIGAALHG